MELKKEQCELLQEELTAANSPEELVKAANAMGCDLTDADAAELLAVVNNKKETEGKLDDELLKPVNGGEEQDIHQLQIIKDIYELKGPGQAFIICIYFIPSPLCYEIIEAIENGVC